MMNKAIFRTFCLVVLLFAVTALSAQKHPYKKVEIEGGVSHIFATQLRGTYKNSDYEYQGKLGFHLNANGYVNQRYHGKDSLRLGLFLGFGYGFAGGELDQLLRERVGENSTTNSMPIVIQRQISTIDFGYQYLAFNLGVRGDISKHLALQLSLQRKYLIQQNNTYTHQLTTTHFFDPTRSRYLQLDEPLESTIEEKFKRDNYFSILVGAEYRIKNDGLYAKALIDFGGHNRTFPFSTFGLQILVGTRI